MSLLRTSSRKRFSMAPEDITASLDQKNSMIAILQAEVQDLRFNHQKHQRLQEEVSKSREKYHNFLRNYEITKVTNQERLDLTAKSCLQLRIQVQHLSKEMQIKNQQLKDAKKQCQYLMQHNNKREDQLSNCSVYREQLNAADDMLKIQEEKMRSQINLSRQELERNRQQNLNINKSYQAIKDKTYKVQSYIRNLNREETSLNQTLSKIEDQNNHLDHLVQELDSVQALTEGKIAHLLKQNQEQKFIISSKQLQIKKLQKETKQTAKTLCTQRQKAKLLIEQVQQKKNLNNRLQSQLRESSDEINFIMSKNNEVSDINSQLKNDLKVCQRHFQNVSRVNKSMQSELTKFKQINKQTIKRLQQPIKQSKNSLNIKQSARKLIQTSRTTGIGGIEMINV